MERERQAAFRKIEKWSATSASRGVRGGAVTRHEVAYAFSKARTSVQATFAFARRSGLTSRT